MKTLVLVIFSVSLLSCSRKEIPSIEIEPTRIDYRNSNKKEELRRFEKFLEKYSKWKYDVKDLHFALKAEVLEDSKEFLGAKYMWEMAFINSNSYLGPKYLKRWYASIQKQIPDISDEEVYEDFKLFVAEEAPEWFKTKSPESQRAWFQKKVLSYDRWEMLSEDDFKEKLDLENDEVLKNASRAYCSTKDNAVFSDYWTQYNKNLPKHLRVYWGGLKKLCRLNYRQSKKIFEKVYRKYSRKPEYHYLARSALRRILQVDRAIGSRKSVAALYVTLVEFLKSTDYKNLHMKSEYDYQINIINQIIWEARYRGLMRDYDGATNVIDNALADLNVPSLSAEKLSPRQRKEVASYYAEAYHVQSFRIDFERKNYASCSKQMDKALSTKYLSRHWRNILHWYKGLYAFLDKDFEVAVKHWNINIDIEGDWGQLPKYYFWLSRAYKELKNEESELEALKELNERFPLSYYTLIAQKRGEDVSLVNSLLSDIENLKAKLTASSNLDLDALRDNDELRISVIRLEMALDSRADTWVNELSNAVYYYAKRSVSIKYSLESMIYISRLMYASGNYSKAIGLTTAFQINHEDFWKNYPEQIFIYFPEPYRNDYDKMSSSLGMSSALLMAISRQESAFQDSVVSSAGAVGLMQLMPNTARGLLKSLGDTKQGKMLSRH